MLYLLYEMSQLTLGKCLRCASFLSKPQNTWTMPRVAEVTGSEKSPPGGDTAPTMVTGPLAVRTAQAAHAPRALVEGRETRAEVCGVAAVRGHLREAPEISRSASAHRDVESAIMEMLYPWSRKYSASVMPV